MAIYYVFAALTWDILYYTKKMVFVPLIFLPTTCANLPSSFVNNCCKNFLCLFSLIRCLYSIASPVDVSIMEFVTS